MGIQEKRSKRLTNPVRDENLRKSDAKLVIIPDMVTDTAMRIT